MNFKNRSVGSVIKIALISLNQKWQDKDVNFARCVELVREAKINGCTLVVFPEMTLTGYSLDISIIGEPELDSPTMDRFGELAKEIGMTIVFGACLFSQTSGKVRNQFCLAQPSGNSQAIYAKIHPFSFAGENEKLEAGDRLGIASVGALEIGASICYDLRFPELYAAMAPICNVAIAIANWPSKRVAHWRALLVARAIENQYYMLGVNRIGEDANGLIYEKSSIVIAPDGTVLEPVTISEELDIFDIDIEEVIRYRAEFPTVRDKRFPLYCDFLGVY